MNGKPIKLEMTRDELADAITQYWNRLLVGNYRVVGLTLHTGARGGAAVRVSLGPDVPEDTDGKD